MTLFLVLYALTIVVLTNELFRRRMHWPEVWEQFFSVSWLTAGLATTAMLIAMALDLFILALIIGGIV